MSIQPKTLAFAVRIGGITTTCCIQWLPYEDCPGCDDSAVMDVIRTALAGASSHDWHSRITAVAHRYGGTLRLLDQWPTIDINQ